MSGLQNASVTKGMMIFLGINTLTIALTDLKPYIHLQLVPHMTKYHQFWRIFLHPIAFANSTELIVGELLLYNAGVQIERSFGPRKFASFILLSSVLSTAFALAAIILFNPFGINFIPAGPYGIIFSLIVPSLYTFRIAGVEFSSRSFIYVLAAQPPSSIVAGLSGILTGYLYRTDLLLPLPSLSRRRVWRPLKSYRIPLSLYTLLSRLFSPLLGTSAPPRRGQRVLPGQVLDNSSGSAAQRRTPGSALGRLLAGRMGGGRPQGIPTMDATPPAPGSSPNLNVPIRRPDGAASSTSTGSAAAGDRPAASMAARGSEARAAMGHWVSEMTGGRGGARAPTEEEIGTLTSMFPNLARETIIRVLQRNDYNTAQAIEALLEEGS